MDSLEYKALLDQKDLKELLVRKGLQYSGNHDINECLDWMVESFLQTALKDMLRK